MLVYVSGDWRVELRPDQAGGIRYQVLHFGALAATGTCPVADTIRVVNARLAELGAPPLEDMTEG